MNYLRQRQQTGPQKPLACLTNKPPVIHLPAGCSMTCTKKFTPLPSPFLWDYSITLKINIASIPGSAQITLSWLETWGQAIGTAQNDATTTGDNKANNDYKVIGVNLVFQGTTWGTLY